MKHDVRLRAMAMTNLPPPASLVLIPDVYDSVWTDLGGVYYWLGESWNECAFRIGRMQMAIRPWRWCDARRRGS